MLVASVSVATSLPDGTVKTGGSVPPVANHSPASSHPVLNSGGTVAVLDMATLVGVNNRQLFIHTRFIGPLGQTQLLTPSHVYTPSAIVVPLT